VYISEAEKYDKALVESWRSDMYGLLIFVCSSFAYCAPCLTLSFFTGGTFLRQPHSIPHRKLQNPESRCGPDPGVDFNANFPTTGWDY
jgi:hypothetical protein